MIILGFHPGYHDSSAALFDDYRLLAAVALERLTRRKGDGGWPADACVDEVLDIAGLGRRDVDAVAITRSALPWRFYRHFRGLRRLEGRTRQLLGREKPKDLSLELKRTGLARPEDIVAGTALLADRGFRAEARLGFANHHLSHALPALFFTDWDEALLYTGDGGGDNVQYSHHLFREGRLESLYGDDRYLFKPRRVDSLGMAYGYATQALGYRINRHEGKLTGLAAYGEPTLFEDLARPFSVDDEGQIHGAFADYAALRRHVFGLAAGATPADVAASVQALLEHFVLASVRRLIERHPVRHLGLSGGIFANVRLNRLLVENTGVDEVFIFPAMGDEGLSVGAALQFLLERDGLSSWLGQRRRLDDVYWGRDYGAAIDAELAAGGFERLSQRPAEGAAELLEGGRIGAIYNGRMEFGPRALGARSILASPADPAINDTLNRRLGRTEFMPYAPVVAAEDAAEVFEVGPANAYAMRFMTITCGVRPAWRERLGAVVHVDNSARPQVIERHQNPLYFDILEEFKRRTGLPVLINTSFNVHEEPIVNTPAECLRALLDGRIDFVVSEKGVYGRG